MEQRTCTRCPGDGGLPLGRHVGEEHARPIGFARARAPGSTRSRLLPAPPGHLLTVAPTGGGKGVGAIIPALLSYDGPVVVVDPKGENLAVTARHRRRRGDRVVVLDPFGITGEPSDSLNPLDLATLGQDAPDDAGRTLADLLTGGAVTLDDPFWDNTAGAFLSGLLTAALADRPPEDRRISWLRDLFGEGDVSYELAVMMDKGGIRTRDARQEVATFLSHPSERTRPSIQSTAAQHLRLFGSDAVRRATDSTSFPVELLTGGAGLSLFIVIPPDKLSSHRSLLRIWLGTIMGALVARRRVPERSLLMLIDEAAQLGRMELLLQATTLLRGYGLRLWTFWQDLSQMRSLYPLEWPTMLNNCGTVQMFGARNWRMAEEFASVAGMLDPAAVLALGPGRQLLVTENGTEIAHRLDYRTDPAFAGLFAPNPFYRAAGTGGRRADGSAASR